MSRPLGNLLLVLTMAGLPGPWAEASGAETSHFAASFAEDEGGLPSAWRAHGNPHESVMILNGALVFQRPADERAPGLRTTLVVEESQDGTFPGEWKNYRVAARLQGSHFSIESNSVTCGVVVRFESPRAPGYTASIRGQNIEILLNPPSNLMVEQGTVLATSDLSERLRSHEWYWLVVEVVDDQLSASVHLDENDAPGEVLGKVSTRDKSFPAGSAGIRVGFTGTDQRSVEVDRFTVSASLP